MYVHVRPTASQRLFFHFSEFRPIGIRFEFLKINFVRSFFRYCKWFEMNIVEGAVLLITERNLVPINELTILGVNLTVRSSKFTRIKSRTFNKYTKCTLTESEHRLEPNKKSKM